MAERGIDYLQSDTKRALDIVSSTAIAGLLLPGVVGLSVVSAIDTKNLRPVFGQPRFGGKLEAAFTAWKLRTIQSTDESNPSQVLGTFDPRATKIGLLLRQSGLDEVPQLLNVITGDMSMVGSRPLPPKAIEQREAADPKLFEEWYPRFQIAKPGMTGESQIYRHHYREYSREVLAKSMRMDLDYFERASLATDLKWLVRTPFDMMWANMHVIDPSHQPSPAVQAAEAPLVL